MECYPYCAEDLLDKTGNTRRVTAIPPTARAYTVHYSLQHELG